MEPVGSLPHSQQPATCPYPETDRFSPCPSTNLSKIHFIIIPHPRVGLPSCPLPSGFFTKTLQVPFLFLVRATCPAHLILLDVITRIFGDEYSE
jgi:hypothetical protein